MGKNFGRTFGFLLSAFSTVAIGVLIPPYLLLFAADPAGDLTSVPYTFILAMLSLTTVLMIVAAVRAATGR